MAREYDFVHAMYLFYRPLRSTMTLRIKPEFRLVPVDRHFPSSQFTPSGLAECKIS